MYWDTLTCGLWYWALDHTSSYVYSDTGARLLNLFFRNLVCMSAFYNAFALVGGGWNNGSAGGLWCWNVTELSSAYGVVGARLIIFKIHIKGFGVLARS